jgi:hypothetical protein
VTGGWSKLHNEDEMGRAYSMNGVKRNAYRILVGNPEVKRTLGKLRRKGVVKVKR